MLTRLEVENARPKDKPYRLFDGRGMYLEISPSGGRYWRLKYRFEGRENRISLGVYPDVGIKEARERCDEARRKLANGVDPSAHRKLDKVMANEKAVNTFEAIAREWFAMHSKRWAQSHSGKLIRRLEMYIFPWLGARPIVDLKPLELLTALRRIESKGVNETAHRALQVCGRVMRYAVATGRVERDFTRDLAGALAPVRERHLASITDPKEAGVLLRTIDGYNGSFITKCALRLAPLVLVRPGELRMAEWSEFDFEKQ
jgi:hypothetical protein